MRAMVTAERLSVYAGDKCKQPITKNGLSCPTCLQIGMHDSELLMMLNHCKVC
jgi:hypothetical protein